jgi:hypothetical protein
MAKGPEYAVKQKVKALLKEHGAWFFMPFMAGMGGNGVPDFVGIHKGKGFGIECKAGKNKTTVLQQIQLAEILAAGGFPLVVNDVTGLDTLEVWLKNG